MLAPLGVSDALVRIPIDGSDTTSFELPVPGFTDLRSLIVGPDARLWLVDGANHTLIAVDTAGTTTTYAQPTGIGMATITSGPDGNVWFVGGNDVGSVSTSGVPVSSRSIPISPTGSAIACSADPAFVRTAGGTTVTFGGRGLDNVRGVWFDSSAAPSFSVISDRQMTVVTPGHPRGFANVSLDTAAGRQTFNTQLRFAGAPVVSSVCPNIGPNAGGYWVTVTGNDVDLATRVYFGEKLTTTVEKIVGKFGEEINKLRVLVPPHKGGAVKMRAYGPMGWGPQGATFVYVPGAPFPVSACAGVLDSIDPGFPS